MYVYVYIYIHIYIYMCIYRVRKKKYPTSVFSITRSVFEISV